MKKSFFEENKYIMLAVFITSIILLITFAFLGYYPFGENSMLRVDLYHQYAPFHEELRNKILTGQSLFYSWEGGLGKEFLSQYAYYTASPISLLILLFPVEYLAEGILLFVFIKVCLCAFSFGYFLKKSFKVNTIFITIFAIMYAFIAYTTSYYWNIMWLDSIYIFPIVILGINRLVEEGRAKTYLFSLMMCILVNFYIAFLVCIFATLYFLVKVFITYKITEDGKVIFDRFLKFGVLSLLAGGATMFLAIPTVVALGRTQTVSSSFPSFEVYQNAWQIISAHFSGIKPVVLARNEDLPNLYSGVLTVMLLPVYFFNREIKIKEKVLFLGLLIFMIACSVFRQLDFIIHGNHFPANLPHRYTFIYSFIILMLAYKAFLNIKGIKPIVMYIFVAINSAVILFTELILVDLIDDISQVLSVGDIVANIAFMILYTFIIVAYKRNMDINQKENVKEENTFISISSILFTIIAALIFFIAIFTQSDYFKEIEGVKALGMDMAFYIFVMITIALIIFAGFYIFKVFKCENKNFKAVCLTMVLLFIVSGESLFNSVSGFAHTGSTDRNAYNQYIAPMKEVLEYIDEKDTDENKFFRQEFDRFTAINESAMYHYNGFSIFSSLAYGDTSQLMEELGIAATSNSYRYYDPTPLIDSMFNIKYVMTKNKALQSESYEGLAEFDNVGLHKNKYPLSVGFMVDKEILDWEVEQETPFITQNEFIHKALQDDTDILEPVHIMNFDSENVDISIKEDKQTDFSYTLHDEKNLEAIPKVTANLYNPKTQRLFIYVESPNSKRFKYDVNGSTNDREISTGRSLIDLGVVQGGETVNIEFALDRKGTYDKTYRETGSFRVYAAGFNMQEYDAIYPRLEDEMLIVDSYDSNTIEGKVTAKEDGILFTSIPYDEGFRVYVDGQRVETVPIAGDGLIGVPVKKGEHTIKFDYYPKGFNLGILLSGISILGIVIYIYADRKKRDLKDNMGDF